MFSTAFFQNARLLKEDDHFDSIIYIYKHLIRPFKKLKNAKMFLKVFNKIINILFPNKCLCCNKYTNDNFFICKECFCRLHINNYFTCPICHKKTDIQSEQNCFHKDNLVKKILYPLDYKDNTVKELIHKFKYNKIKTISKTFRFILEQSLTSYLASFSKNEWIIIPVPLHFLKQKQRGFNQSDIIGTIISDILKLPIQHHIIIRHKNNPPQAKSLNQEERLLNTQNIFKINASQKNIIFKKNIILVDDVFTTGATLNECARILKENGAKNIIAICLAR